jgi:hypothetical protein
VLQPQAVARAAWDAGNMDDAWGTIDEIIEWLDGGSTLQRLLLLRS